MPRRDGTGPMGDGPLGRGRGGCQRKGLGDRLGFHFGFSRGQQSGFGFTGNPTAKSEALEEQAERLEAQAAGLRKRAAQNRKPE